MLANFSVIGRPWRVWKASAWQGAILVFLTAVRVQLRATLPPGCTIEYDGIAIDSGEGKTALAANVPLCIGAMFLLLIAQFNSFRRPLLIVATIPLRVVGAAVGLLVMRADFGFMVILCLLSLILTQAPPFYGKASVIAFGPGIGTVMTLDATPVLYALFFRGPHPSPLPSCSTSGRRPPAGSCFEGRMSATTSLGGTHVRH